MFIVISRNKRERADSSSDVSDENKYFKFNFMLT